MAEAIGIDKDKPNKAITVAVKMLKGTGNLWRVEHHTVLGFPLLPCLLQSFVQTDPVEECKKTDS